MCEVQEGQDVDLGVGEQRQVRQPRHTHHVVVEDAVAARGQETTQQGQAAAWLRWRPHSSRGLHNCMLSVSIGSNTPQQQRHMLSTPVGLPSPPSPAPAPAQRPANSLAGHESEVDQVCDGPDDVVGCQGGPEL